MIEDRKYTCPVCNHFEYGQVRVYGDSDGDDGRGVLEIDKCPRCRGWKEASPILYEKLLHHYNTAQEIEEKTIKKVEHRYKNYVSPSILSSPLQEYDFTKNVLARFNESIKFHEYVCKDVCNDTKTPFNKRQEEWCLRESLKDVICYYIDMTKKNKKIEDKEIEDIENEEE